MLAHGFNTWYNNSIASHVLLPEGIALSLAFKFYNTCQVLREPLFGRHGESDEKIFPGPRSYDGSYTELRLECSGHEILLQSAAIGDQQYVLVTPLNRQVKPATVFVVLAMLWNKPGYVKLEGGRLLAVTPARELEVFSGGRRIRQLNSWLTNPNIALELSAPLAISTEKVMDAEAMAALMARQKAALLASSERYGPLAEAYNAMRSCIAWDTIYEPEKDRICSPVSRLWSINWGGYVLFDWDTYFAAMMTAVENRELAYTCAASITEEVTESGFIPNFSAADGYASRDRSQPPVGSLVIREIYRIYRDRDFVRPLFDTLLGWNRWFAEHRRARSGPAALCLCWGSDPFTPVAGGFWETHHVNTSTGAALESGMDNSTLYDDMPFDEITHLMLLADTGLTGLYILDCECLADLAVALDRPSDAAELRQRAAETKQALDALWDEETGCYLNRRTDTGEFSRRMAPTHFYALFSDSVPPERAERMMREHFYNPEEFFGAYMIPCTGRNEPGYHDQNYWRGRIWAPVNYLCYLALRKAGRRTEQKILSDKSLALFMQEWTEKGHIHENFNGDTGRGCDVPNSDSFYHWGGLLAFTALTEAGHLAGPETPL
jgi:hypothetical protein